MRATKWAMRRMSEMTFDNAMDYLIRAQEALNGMGGAAARKEATKQFLDDKLHLWKVDQGMTSEINHF